MESNPNIPCTCGHSFEEHNSNKQSLDYMVCLVQSLDKKNKLLWKDQCLEFKADNLRYLEQLDEKKNG